MATFSVYDYDRRMFDYYEAPGAHQALGSAKFSTFRKVKNIGGETQLGAIPESIAQPLPFGAKKVGEGEDSIGVVATKGSPGSGGYLGLGEVVVGGKPVPGFIVYGGAAIISYLAWRKLK